MLVFLVVALVAYVGTVAAAFVYWDATGASGPDPTPLLFVLFALAPAVAVVAGWSAVRRRRSRPAPAAGGLPAGGTVTRAAPARRNGPLQWAIAIGGALLVGAVMLAVDRAPMAPYLPRGAFTSFR